MMYWRWLSNVLFLFPTSSRYKKLIGLLNFTFLKLQVGVVKKALDLLQIVKIKL